MNKLITLFFIAIITVSIAFTVFYVFIFLPDQEAHYRSSALDGFRIEYTDNNSSETFGYNLPWNSPFKDKKYQFIFENLNLSLFYRVNDVEISCIGYRSRQSGYSHNKTYFIWNFWEMKGDFFLFSSNENRSEDIRYIAYIYPVYVIVED